MTIQEKIKADMVIAMKAKETEKLSLLRVVMGEFANVASRMPNNADKILSDDLAIKELRRMFENAQMLGNKEEVEILNKYLPKMLTEDEMKIIVNNIISANNIVSSKEMGKFMGILKLYPESNLMDKNFVTKYFRERLGV